MALPTWNGEPVTADNITSVMRESFELLTDVMGGGPVTGLSLAELLHVVEAGSHLGAMAAWTELVAMPLAREAGASWATLAAVMGVPRSTAQSRYKKSTQDSAHDTAGD